MAIQPMTDAVAGQPALSAEYNKLIDNIEDLDGRLTTATTTNNTQATAINTLESRTTNASTGNTQLGTRVTALEGLKLSGSYYGQWTDNATGSGLIVDHYDGEVISDITTAVGTPTGCSLSGGYFTANQAGLWMFTLSIQTIGGTGNVGTRAIFMWKGQAPTWNTTGIRYGLTASGKDATALTTVAMIRLNAGEKITPFIANWSRTANDIPNAQTQLYKAAGNSLTAVWLAP